MADEARTLQPGSYGDKPALIMGASGEVVTHRQLDERSMRLAQLMWNAGLRPGDHIAILMENNARYFEIAWAAQRSGLYYTPVNWHLAPAEARYIIEDCGAKAIFTSVAMSELARALGDIPQVTLRLMTDGTVAGFDSWEAAAAACPAQPLEREVEGSAMCYSSGTTGRPKGVLRPLRPTPFGAGTITETTLSAQYPFSGSTVYLSPGPLYHAAPIYWTMMAQRFGGTAVVMEKFDPVLTLDLIQRHRVTMAQFVPTMFIRMLKLPEAERKRHDHSSLKFAIHAAAPCPVWVKEKMIEWWGPVIHEFYGATEGGLISVGPEEWLQHKGTVGKPKHFKVHVIGEDGQDLPPGQPGVIYLEGAAPFEYHRDPERTAEAVDRRGWITVGDIGYLDEEGYLYLSDRKAHMIISGGVNIYPQEVENLLVRHPKVADAAVIGVPNEEYGEEVKAVVQLAHRDQASTALEQELIAYCRDNLAHFKCPRTVDFVTELPRLESGKLQKRQIKDRYWQDRVSRI